MQCRSKLSQIIVHDTIQVRDKICYVEIIQYRKNTFTRFPSGWFLQVPASRGQDRTGQYGKSVRVPGWTSVESRGEAILLQGAIGQFIKQSKRTKFSGKRDKSVGKETTKSKKSLISIDGDGDHDDLMTSVTMSPCRRLQGFYSPVEADLHQSSSQLELRIMTILSSCALLPAPGCMMSEVFIYLNWNIELLYWTLFDYLLSQC